MLTRAARRCTGSLSNRVGTLWLQLAGCWTPVSFLPATKCLQAPDLEGFMGQLCSAGVSPARLAQHAEVGLALDAPLVGGAVLQQAAGCCPGWGYQPLQQFLHTASPNYFQGRYGLSQCRTVDKPVVQVSHARKHAAQQREHDASICSRWGARRSVRLHATCHHGPQQQAHGLWHTSRPPDSEPPMHGRCTAASHACPLP